MLQVLQLLELLPHLLLILLLVVLLRAGLLVTLQEVRWLLQRGRPLMLLQME